MKNGQRFRSVSVDRVVELLAARSRTTHYVKEKILHETVKKSVRDILGHNCDVIASV